MFYSPHTCKFKSSSSELSSRTRFERSRSLSFGDVLIAKILKIYQIKIHIRNFSKSNFHVVSKKNVKYPKPDFKEIIHYVLNHNKVSLCILHAIYALIVDLSKLKIIRMFVA